MTRDSREEPSALVPGKRYQVKVRLNGVAYSFPPRLSPDGRHLKCLLASRLAISPIVSRNCAN